MKKTTLILAAFLLLYANSIAQVNLQNGLVGYWPFNGNANDESGNGYHGTVNGANLTTDRFGNENSAYSFNGNDQYIELANTSDLNMFSGFSLVAWVNFTASNGSSIISKHINYYYNGFTLSADNNNANLATNNNQYYLATTETYNDGEWHMFVGTLNGNTMSIYVDGMLKATGSTDYTIGNDMNIRIGADSMISFFDGKIDDVRIYSRLLNAQEIQFLVHEGETNPVSGLVAWYPFNGNANDESGNGFHGTVNGASLTTDRYENENSAYLFNGLNDHIIVDSAFFNIGWDEYSISCWVNSSAWYNPNSNVGNQEIINTIPHNGLGLGFNWGGTNKYGICLNSDPSQSTWNILTGTSNTGTTINQWNHLVFVKKLNQYKLYVNGSLDNIFSGSVMPMDYLCRIVLGSIEPAVEDEYFMGKLDDYLIYNRALTEPEILSLYSDYTDISFTTPDVTAMNNSVFEIPVHIDGLNSGQNIISYQFNFHYDDYVLQYEDCNMQGTLAENGNIQVNNMPNKLSVAWAGQTALAGSGTLLKLRFKSLHEESFHPFITDCLINTDTIRNITNGLIAIISNLGDVDDNGSIQAYDAAITLQYSVGLDPLPDVDPLPWNDWRVMRANVDGQSGITAYDASLMLQYTVGIINSFPDGGSKKSASGSLADVIISIENGYIVFRSMGDLKGLNLTVEGSPELMGSPQVFDTNMILAANISSSVYSVGLATASSPEENEIIMKIPLTESSVQSLMLSLTVNNQKKQVNLLMPVSSPEIPDKNIEIYPNPANKMLYFRNLSGQTSISIYDLQGREIIAETITDYQIDISRLDHGIYTIRIEDGKKIKIGKLLKQ